MLTTLALIAAVRWTSVLLLFVTIACTLLVAHFVRTWVFGTRSTGSARPGSSRRPADGTAKRQPDGGRKKARRK